VTNRPVRLGVLGCGVIAYWTHLREIDHVQGARLVVAADPDSAARARTERLTGVPVHERAEDLFARDDVDAVVISAPTHLHAELAVAAATAQRHFYLEKPLATTAVEARRILHAVEGAAIMSAMGFNRRCHPLFEQARNLITAGRIGAVRTVVTAFCEPTPPAAMPAWKQRRATGGGVMLDLASHHVDLVRWLLDDEVSEVEARLLSEASEHDTAWLRLAMRGGVEVRSFFSFRAGRTDFFEIIGEHGTLRIDRHRCAVSLRLPRRFGYGVRRGLVLPRPDLIRWRLRRLVRPSYEPSYRRALAGFVELLQGQPRRVSTLADGMHALEIVLAAEEASRVGRAVAVTSFEPDACPPRH
jgi:myo-inositol 2-dehydrogenase / D-chiro-inositol 1-dehydrogenase